MQDTGRILLPDRSLQELYGIAINEMVHSTVDLLSLSLLYISPKQAFLLSLYSPVWLPFNRDYIVSSCNGNIL